MTNRGTAYLDVESLEAGGHDPFAADGAKQSVLPENYKPTAASPEWRQVVGAVDADCYAVAATHAWYAS